MWDHFSTFLAKPFSSDMSAADWFLFIGLLLIIIVLWTTILRHLSAV